MKKLITLILAALMLLAFAAPAEAQPYKGYPLQLCTNATGNPAPCRWLRFLSGNSAGMGTLDLMPVGAALYKWDSTSARFVRWDGSAGTATAPSYFRLVDGDGTPLQDVLDTFADNQALTLNGGVTASVMYGYDGTTLSMMRVEAVDSDNVLETTLSMPGKSFLFGYEPGAAQWDRLQVHAAGDALSATQQGLDVLGHTLYYDGTQFRRWEGDAAGDALSATQTAPYTLGLNLFYDGTNYRRWQGVTMADNLSLPTAPHVGAVMLGYDGATLDMLQVDGTGALEVVDTSNRPGEDAGAGLVHVGLKATTEYDPAKVTTTGIAAVSTSVLGPIDVSGQRRCCVYLQNDAGDGDPFTDALIMFGPNTTDMPTVGNGSWTACDSLADGEICHYCWDDAHGAVEVEVTGAGGADVDVDAWIHCTQ